MLKTFTLMLILGSAAMAQPHSDGVLVNGNFWNALSLDSSKTGFLLGYQQGLAAGTILANERSKEKFDLVTNAYPSTKLIGPKDIIPVVDRFYRDPPNRSIPIAWALVYISAEATGTEPGKLAEFLALLRKGGAEALLKRDQ